MHHHPLETHYHIMIHCGWTRIESLKANSTIIHWKPITTLYDPLWMNLELSHPRPIPPSSIGNTLPHYDPLWMN
jgi:hypothetical protein